MKVFVDTSAFYALASDSDAAHREARAIHEQLKDLRTTLMTSNYVLLESISLLQRRHGVDRAERFGDFVADHVDLVWVDAARHRVAWKVWKSQRQRGLSLVDCSSFVIMRDLGIEHAFAFDQQFREAGFMLLSGPANFVAEPRGTYRMNRVKPRSVHTARR